MNMNKLVLTLLAIMTILPVVGQSEYISNSRDMDSDCIENLDGRYGLLLLSHNKSLVINITNASRPFEIIRPKSVNANGLYEYRVIMDIDDTHNPKVEVNRMSDLYKTEFVANLKPDFLVAYQILEVEDPIRMEDQTQSNDAILDATKAELELTTNIKNLIVKCNPNLKADVKTSVSKADATVNIISVVFPIAEMQAAKKEMSEAQSD